MKKAIIVIFSVAVLVFFSAGSSWDLHTVNDQVYDSWRSCIALDADEYTRISYWDPGKWEFRPIYGICTRSLEYKQVTVSYSSGESTT